MASWVQREIGGVASLENQILAISGQLLNVGGAAAPLIVTSDYPTASTGRPGEKTPGSASGVLIQKRWRRNVRRQRPDPHVALGQVKATVCSDSMEKSPSNQQHIPHDSAGNGQIGSLLGQGNSTTWARRARTSRQIRFKPLKRVSRYPRQAVSTGT